MKCSCGNELIFKERINNHLFFFCSSCQKELRSSVTRPKELEEMSLRIKEEDDSTATKTAILVGGPKKIKTKTKKIELSHNNRAKHLADLEIEMINELSGGVVSGDRVAQKLFCDILERKDKKKKKYFSPADYQAVVEDVLKPPPDEYIKKIISMMDEDGDSAAPIIAANIKKLSFFYAIEYLPHPKQLLCHFSPARFKVVAAGARAGKSMLAGAEAAYLFFVQPDARIWCVSSQYSLAEKEFDWALSFLHKIKLKTKDNASLVEYCNMVNANKGGREINSSWGSFIHTKSTEKPPSLLGEELDMIVMGEASQVQEIAWTRYLRARIGPRHGQLLAISTPNSDAGLFMDFFVRGESKEQAWDAWESWQFPTNANPHFSQSEFETAKTELDDKIFQEQYEGKFVSRKGFVFGNIKGNIVENDKYPEDIYSFTAIWSVSYNYNRPAVAVLMFLAPKERKYYFLKEIYLRNSMPESITQQMKDASKGLRVRGIIVGKKDYIIQDELKKNNLSYVFDSEAKINENEALRCKIMNLRSLLETNAIIISEETPNLIRELEKMKWSSEEGKKTCDIPEVLQMPLVAANAVAFWDIARGIDVYKAQRK